MKWFLTMAAVLVVGTSVRGDDLGKLQGRWEAKAGKRVEFQVALEIEGSKVTATIVPKVGPPLKATGEIRVDQATSPRSIDWVKFSTRDGQDVPTMLAIYRVDGDRFTIRNGGFNDTRPSGFEGAGEGVWTQVVEFKRASTTTAANPGPKVAARP